MEGLKKLLIEKRQSLKANKGFFKIKKVIIVKTDGDTKERKQGVVTPKGIDWLLQYFKKCVLK